MTDHRDEEISIEEVVQNTIQEIWDNFDKDKSGFLDKNEAKQFVKSTLMEVGDNGEFSETEFEKCFKEFDKDGNGKITKEEMKAFIMRVAGA